MADVEANESDDEDYVPPANESDDEEGGAEDTHTDGESICKPLSYLRQRAVDDAFASLMGVDSTAQGTGAISTVAMTSNLRRSKRRKTGKRKRQSREELKKARQFRILAEIFGPSEAARLMATAAQVCKADLQFAKRRRGDGDGDVWGPKTKTVMEVKQFAGQSIVVPTTQTIAQQESSAKVEEDKPTAATSAPPEAIASQEVNQAVASSLATPKSFTTATVTSTDSLSLPHQPPEVATVATGAAAALQPKPQELPQTATMQSFSPSAPSTLTHAQPTVMPPSSSNIPTAMPMPTKAVPAPATGLDAVLAQMQGPAKISTMAKTNVDWESFKTKTGLEEQLEQQSKSNQAYLERQDFLNRVDVRRFDVEKAQRDVERSAAAAAAKGKK